MSCLTLVLLSIETIITNKYINFLTERISKLQSKVKVLDAQIGRLDELITQIEFKG